jgi:hypothetical protein
MPTPAVKNVTPTKVHLKQNKELTVHGEHFAGDEDGNCSVSLTSKDGFIWTPNPATGTVVSSHKITVEATPTAPEGKKKKSGTGDLTTTVTNGDGSGMSVPVSQGEEYLSD